jgi:hypothetical protein
MNMKRLVGAATAVAIVITVAARRARLGRPLVNSASPSAFNVLSSSRLADTVSQGIQDGLVPRREPNATNSARRDK